MNDTTKNLISALRNFAESRPGLDPRDYGGNWKSYRAEARSITRDLKDARILLTALELVDILEKDLTEGFHAYAGRLSYKIEGGKVRLDYCVGQYYPTEFRRAVCAVASSALWAHYREKVIPRPDRSKCRAKACTCHDSTAWVNGETYQSGGCSACGCRWESPGDAIRRKFVELFGRHVAKRWFN